MIIAIHTDTVHCPVARARLLAEAQGIISDADAPEARKQFAAAFIRRNRGIRLVLDGCSDDGPEVA